MIRALHEFSKLAAKSIGLFSFVICLNYGIAWALGLSSDFMQHAWGIFSMLVFVEGITLHNDLNLLQERFDDMVTRHTFMQDLYTQEKTRTQNMHLAIMAELKSGMENMSSNLSSMSNSMKSKSSPESNCVDVETQYVNDTPVSGISPMNSLRPIPPLGTEDQESSDDDTDYEKRKIYFRDQFKKPHSFHGASEAMRMQGPMTNKKVSMEEGDEVKMLHFSVELHRKRSSSGSSHSSAPSPE